jgi:hypothetical protein
MAAGIDLRTREGDGLRERKQGVVKKRNDQGRRWWEYNG